MNEGNLSGVTGKPRTIRNNAIIVALCFIFQSCEGFLYIQGCVKDSETNQPIENSYLYIKYEGKTSIDTFYMEANGCISYNMLVSCVPNCPTYEVLVIAPEYDTLILSGNIFKNSETFHLFSLEKSKIENSSVLQNSETTTEGE